MTYEEQRKFINRLHKQQYATSLEMNKLREEILGLCTKYEYRELTPYDLKRFEEAGERADKAGENFSYFVQSFVRDRVDRS